MALFSAALLERMRRSPAWGEDRFTNILPSPVMSVPSPSMLKRFLFEREGREPPRPLPSQRVDPAVLAGPAHDGWRVTWLGHSTTLLELGGRRVLLDPVWSERASPSELVGPRRFQPVPLAIEALPKLDLVLLSHDHYDHLDVDAVRALAARGVPFVTGLGVGARLEQWGVAPTQVTQLDWWQEHQISAGLRVRAMPARHFSGRGALDRNKTLWASWSIEANGMRVFFGGDGGFDEDCFRSIGERAGPFDLTMLEIGAFDLAWEAIHLGPVNAVRAHALVKGATLLPVHWGTFDLGLHAWDAPIEELLEAVEGTDVRLALPRIGQSAAAGAPLPRAPWWRAVEGAHAPRTRARVKAPSSRLVTEG